MTQFSIEALPNGLTRVRDRQSGLCACYHTATGGKAFGDLPHLTLSAVRNLNR